MRKDALRWLLVATLSLAGAWAKRVEAVAAPLSFEANLGQEREEVLFLSRAREHTLLLGRGGSMQLAGGMRLRLAGANPNASTTAQAPQAGVVNYLIGSDRARWRTGVPTYGRIHYAGVYAGVDLLFYGAQRALEYDFIVAPGADSSRICWEVGGAGARIDADGNLVLEATGARALFRRPVAYQIIAGSRVGVSAAFTVRGRRVGFRLGPYDHTRPLTIDPVLTYATYLAGSGTDTIGRATGPGNLQVGVSQALAVDSAGSVYVTGGTYSADFPTQKGYQSALPAKLAGSSPTATSTAFVSKFSPDGGSLVYSTYLGGNSSDYAYAIAVDPAGAAYVAGLATSTNFPVTAGSYQTVCAPTPANHGAPYTASCNSSNWSVFVTKLNPAGNGLVYSTFLGGYGLAYATAIAVDAAGRAYIAGNTATYCSAGFSFQACFPTTGGAVIGGDKTGGRSPQYAFAAVFDPSGAQLLYSTLFGDLNSAGTNSSGGGSYATGLALDASGDFYLIGDTQAGRLPTTVSAVQPTSAPLDASGQSLQAWRGFVARFNPVTTTGGVSLAYATYLGGKTVSTSDYLSGIALDGEGNAFVAGYTNSKDFPVTAGAYQTVCGPAGATCSGAHITKLNSTGSAILWSTYLGSARSDGGDNLTFTGPVQLDGNGNVYLLGQAGPAFPMRNPVEPPGSGGAQHLLVAELDAAGANLLFATRIGSGGKNTSYPAGMVVDAAGNIYLAGNNLGSELITTAGSFQSSIPTSTCCYHGFAAKLAPGAGRPVITAVVNGASFQPGIAAGSWVTIRGSNLANTGSGRTWRGDEIVNGQLPTSLDGVSVTINGKAAFVYYISAAQINVQAPSDTAQGAVKVVVENNGQTSDAASVQLQAFAPALFQFTGSRYAIITRNGDNALIADPAEIPIATGARPGDVLILWGTGFGATNPDAPAGHVVSGAPAVATPPVILIDGAPVTVYGAALSPGSVGLYQVAIQLPAALSAGDHSIVAKVGGVQSPAGVDVFVARQ
jgi:uncharacterized protein (TIGR03437 family)